MPKLDAIGVIVSDMDASVAFYRKLGLQFPNDPGSEGHIESTLPGGLRFLIDTEESVKSFAPEWSPPTGGPRVGIAFLCDSVDDVDRLYGELVGAGATGIKEPWDAFWGQRYAQIQDPDGNAVDLFAPLQT
jgi:catechol 2,3-dioxygenase-like lactoylglutathione lyase family enzyme